jgi:hypothetical protein
MCEFRAFEYLVKLIVGVKVPVVVGNGVLDEFSGTLEFFLCRFFGAQQFVLVSFWLLQVSRQRGLAEYIGEP